MMKPDLLSSMLMKLVFGIATAATIGGGTAVIRASATNAVQDQRLTQLEKDREEMHELSKNLVETNRNVAVLNERLTEEVERGR